MADTSRCQGTNREGGPCSATPRTGKQWCIWHDPTLAEQRRRWNSEAGRAKSNASRARKRVLTGARDLAEVDAALCLALDKVLAGDIEPNVATAAASLARAIVSARQASAFEDRLAELEVRAGLPVRGAS